MLTTSYKVRMLRCATSIVIAAYVHVRLIPQDLRALPAAFLQSRPETGVFMTFYEFVKIRRDKNTFAFFPLTSPFLLLIISHD
ncbi:MAG: hypothetical protein C0394_08840 [Syntrophus sp. (in: bacteria)]|nr:hypothetical protein [Syntrophus sp. (in: bacteria)]